MAAVDDSGDNEIDMAEFVQFMVNLKNRDSKKEKKPKTPIKDIESMNTDDKIAAVMEKSKQDGEEVWHKYMEDVSKKHEKSTRTKNKVCFI